MAPLPDNCPIKHNSETRQALLDLFLALQHPYIYPVLDIDRKIILEQEYVIAVLPFNEKGTLKDVIYQSRCQDDWKQKYQFHGYGLEAAQIQRLGCQVLEAMLFLKDQGFPVFLHLHSGNIILQNGVARISGLENALFGYTSRSLVLIPKRLQDNKEAAETIRFGHLLFEMVAGYELTTSHPSEKNYTDIENTSKRVLDVLKFIFEQGRYSYPTLQQVASLEFFRHIDLRELRSVMPFPSIKGMISPASKAILKDIRKHQRTKRHNKRSKSMSTLETASVDSRDSKSSGGSSRASRRKKKRALPSSETIAAGLCSTQLQTLPLPEATDSSISLNAPSGSGSVDYYTPPTTPLPRPRPVIPVPSATHTLLLQEIQGGYTLKHVHREKDPTV